MVNSMAAVVAAMVVEGEAAQEATTSSRVVAAADGSLPTDTTTAHICANGYPRTDTNGQQQKGYDVRNSLAATTI